MSASTRMTVERLAQLRTEWDECWTPTDEEFYAIMDLAAQALARSETEKANVMVPRAWFSPDADHAGKPIWIMDTKLVGETLDDALKNAAPQVPATGTHDALSSSTTTKPSPAVAARCSCGWPVASCARTQTDCQMYQPRREPTTGGSL